jgi:hypothetical protein
MAIRWARALGLAVPRDAGAVHLVEQVARDEQLGRAPRFGAPAHGLAPFVERTARRQAWTKRPMLDKFFRLAGPSHR